MKDQTEYPSGFREAYEKYLGSEDSQQRIWEALLEWDNFQPELQDIDLAKKRRPAAYLEMLEAARKRIANFDAHVLKRWHERDVSFLRKAIKAMESRSLPRSSVNGYKAALIAFSDLFVERGLGPKENWPTKKEVRDRAELILKKSGVDLVGTRQWARIFTGTGLKDLESVPQLRVRIREEIKRLAERD